MASQKQARGGNRPQGGGQSRTGQNSGGQSRTGQNSGGQSRTGQNSGGQSRTSQNSGGQSRTGQNSRPGPSQAVTKSGADPAPARPVASWPFQLATLVLALCGLGVSIYLTIAHLTSPTILACPDKGFINCAAVTTSPESRLFGVFPVSELGLAFYAFMVAINSPWAWRSKLPQIYWIRLGSVVVGMGLVLWLVYAELLLIKNICLFCTAVHVITFILFVMLVFHATGRSAPTAANQRRLTPAARMRD
jgi:uncharacterized membrane protein